MKKPPVSIQYLKKSRLYSLYMLISTSTPLVSLALCKPSTRERSEEGLLDLYAQGLNCYYILVDLFPGFCRPILRRLDDTDH